jgi:hypothetical protein
MGIAALISDPARTNPTNTERAILSVQSEKKRVKNVCLIFTKKKKDKYGKF